jgi:hypothetical protein
MTLTAFSLPCWEKLRQQHVKKCASQHIMQYLFRRFLCVLPLLPLFPYAKNVFVTSKMSVGQHNTQKHFKPSPTTPKNDPFYLYSVYCMYIRGSNPVCYAQ